MSLQIKKVSFKHSFKIGNKEIVQMATGRQGQIAKV